MKQLKKKNPISHLLLASAFTPQLFHYYVQGSVSSRSLTMNVPWVVNEFVSLAYWCFLEENIAMLSRGKCGWNISASLLKGSCVLCSLCSMKSEKPLSIPILPFQPVEYSDSGLYQFNPVKEVIKMKWWCSSPAERYWLLNANRHPSFCLWQVPKSLWPS